LLTSSFEIKILLRLNFNFMSFKKIAFFFSFLIATFFWKDSSAQIDGRSVVLKTIAASKQLKSYEGEMYDSSSIGNVSRYEIIEQIKYINSNSPDSIKYQYSMSGKIRAYNSNKLRPFTAVHDGDNLKLLDYEDNSVLFLQQPSQKTMGTYFGRLQYPNPGAISFFGITEKDIDKFLKSVTAFKLLEDTVIDGVNCYSVEYTRTLVTPDKQTVSSVSTHFFNKVNFYSVGISGRGYLKIFKLKSVNKLYDFAAIEVKAPGGFIEKKVTNYIGPDTKDLLSVNSDAPFFKLKNGDGKNVSLTDLKGKTILLDFWGTWCGPCLFAMPHIQSLHTKYKDKGLVVIGISVADAEGKPQKYMKSKGYTYGLLINGEEAARAFKVSVFPTIYLISKEGKIVYAERGIRETFEADISKIIESVIK
jgi:thiol-disulfide isomerase/thioredoxin